MFRVVFELPREASHGDIATNAAMVLAKQVGNSPRDLAKLLLPSSKQLMVLPTLRLPVQVF